MSPASSLQALLAEIGPRWHSDIRKHSQAVKDAYDPILAAASRDGMAQTRDLLYGPHERHRLDVVAPIDPAALHELPLLVARFGPMCSMRRWLPSGATCRRWR